MASKLLPFLWFLLLLSVAADFETISLGNPFNESSASNFYILGNAKIEQNALQLTIDTSNVESFFVNNSGRIIFKKPYKIWDWADSPTPSNTYSSPRKVISFNSSFVFNLYPVNNKTVGEGLAFVIFPDRDWNPDNSYGEFLGLTNSSLDGNPNNKLFAVEFDTFKQPYDPDNNHVGLNINSVNSIVTRSLSDFNITLAPFPGVKYRAWIDYSGPLHRIEVYLSKENESKPAVPLLNATIDLSAHLAKESYFGFSGSTGLQFQLNCVLSWSLRVEILQEKKPFKWFLIIGVPIAGALLLAVACLGLWAYRRRERPDQKLEWTLRSLPGTPREFPYTTLKKATGNFAFKNQLGKGGFGVVFKGVIPGENVTVAVKKFLRDTMQGDFLAELNIINRLRHKNLVRLLGWCHKNGKLLLVYEFMPNGSLDQHLYSEPPAQPLPWDCRLQILTGVASALNYLHNEYDQKVLHRDLKSSNILLDKNFHARLGDFGLARAIDNECTSYATVEVDGVAGTMGYIAPECFHTGKATRVSDVFGFGAVILEVVCGKRPHCDVGQFKLLTDWVWNLYRNYSILDAVDPRLGEEYPREEAKRLLLLGLACSHPNSVDRPTTHDVLQIILGSLPPPEIPSMKPAFIWPSVCVELYEDGTETTRSISTATSFSSHRVQGQRESSDTFHSIPLR